MRVSKYYGMEIYTLGARRVGKVTDVLLELNKGGGRIIAIEMNGAGIGIPYESVFAVGDIVLVKNGNMPQEKM